MEIEHSRRFDVVFPNLCKEWNYERNASLTPDMVTFCSGKKVWWICSHRHEWQARISSRKNGAGCPFCSGRVPVPGKTDLATLYPSLAQEWCFELNGPLLPSMFTAGSNRRVYWICSQYHVWRTGINTRTAGAKCPYCQGKLAIRGVNDLLTLRPDLAEEWDCDKNGTLTPADVMMNSHRKVWWVCEQGHTWRAIVQSRVRGNGCPVCTNRLIVAGENDLATTHPEIAEQWCYSKNGNLTPERVTYGSGKKVWWVCEKQHIWKATICDRTQGHGCPICTNQTVLIGENDLASTYPEIATEWNFRKNGELLPSQVVATSPRRVWWVCTDGHEWIAEVITRTNGSKCPYCQRKQAICGDNDLESTYPLIAEEWDFEQNIPLLPSQVLPGSNALVWWQCMFGHRWRARVYTRMQGRKCPYCQNKAAAPGENDLLSQYPIIAEEWDFERNAPLLPSQVLPGSNKKMGWICEKQHTWMASVSSRTHGHNCPVCAGSVAAIGENDIFTLFPSFAAEWDYEKNKGLDPQRLTRGSNRNAWWKCGKGHSWQAAIIYRANGEGCPICRKRKSAPAKSI